MTGSRSITVAVEDVVYLHDRGQSLQARIYRPPGPGPFPLLLHVHGGVWTAGGRTNDAATCRWLAERGIVVVAIDVVQPPAGGYPASIAEVDYAVRWLAADAERLHARSEWIFGLGLSSGGHQLLLATLCPDDPRFSSIQAPPAVSVTPALAGLVLCYPVTDPIARYRWAKDLRRDRLVSGHLDYWGDESAMIDGSPQRVLEESEPHAPLPPVLLVYGESDDNIPTKLTERFEQAYAARGGAVRVVRFPGMPHNFLKNRPEAPETRQALGAIEEFIGEKSR